MNISKHAEIRGQQRGIQTQLAVEVLRTYGKRAYDSQGSVLRYLDRQSRRKIRQELGPDSKQFLEKHGNVYCVENIEDRRVITVGHRYKRLKGKAAKSKHRTV